MRETLVSDIGEYGRLRATLEGLKQVAEPPVKAKVDLGCGFFIDSEV